MEKHWFENLLAAQNCLRGAVLTSRMLDAEVNAWVFLKCENFQRVGAFKFRGAFNAISRLSTEQRSWIDCYIMPILYRSLEKVTG